MGTPLKLLRIITVVMQRGSTFLKGAEQEIFRTTHGVKQWCPLFCFLFVVVFDIPLRMLDQHGITFSAYVDDICSPTPPKRSQQQAQLVQDALAQSHRMSAECRQERVPPYAPLPHRSARPPQVLAPTIFLGMKGLLGITAGVGIGRLLRLPRVFVNPATR